MTEKRMELISLEKFLSKKSVDAVIKYRLIEANFISKFQGKETSIHPKTVEILSARDVLIETAFFHLLDLQTKGAMEVGNLPEHLQFLNRNRTSAMRVHAKHTCIPPDAVARHTAEPFLFKCCHVEYNEATDRLEISKGEYVGKVVTTLRDMDTPCSNSEDTKYDDILVEATDQTDLPGKCI